MSGKLSGKVAVVTGAGRGLGRAYAIALAAEGARVVVNDTGGDQRGMGSDRSPASDVVNEIEAAGGEAIENYDDVSDFQQAENIMLSAIERFSQLDVLVTSAGVDRRGYLYDISEADWDKVFQVHVKGTFNCNRHAAKIMKEQQSGAIVNITSAAFFMGVPRLGAYAAAKGAIYGMARTLFMELQPFGVSVNTVAPGLARTRQVETWLESLSELPGGEQQAKAMDAMLQEPEAVAPLIVFLATNEGRKLTGHTFDIDRDRVSVIAPPSPHPSAFTPSGRWTVDELVSVLPRLVSG
ncbi:MAG: SDR family NAD(P)-dependent oxidoreductase [Chloroflexi bacterium]|nr:SDR family NAD(P)-dependent oxidoreductase [Chloroflexota bacterium]